MRMREKGSTKTVTNLREVWSEYHFLIIFAILGVIGMVFLNSYIG